MSNYCETRVQFKNLFLIKIYFFFFFFFYLQESEKFLIILLIAIILPLTQKTPTKQKKKHLF